MVARVEPVVSAALGAASSFYLLIQYSCSPVAAAAVFLLLSTISSAAVAFSPLRARGVRSAVRIVLAFCVGAAVGAAAADVPPPRLFWGLPPNRVRTIAGTIVSDPRAVRPGSAYASVRLEKTAGGGESASAGGVASVFFPAGTEPLPPRGAALEFAGRVEDGRNGPVFKARTAVALREAPAPAGARTAIRRWVVDILGSAPWGALSSALLLGDRDGLDGGESEAYAAAGCAHVLALSGMHLALVSALLSLALKPLLGLRRGLLAGCVLIFSYVALAGWQASLVRAALMYALGAVGVFLASPRRPLPLLSAAFMIQLVSDPIAAHGLSFILSYAALAGLCTVGEAVADLSRAWLPEPIRSPLSASVGAFLATAALCSAAFGVLRPIGIAASLVLAPAALAFMVGGMVFIALSAVHPVLALPVDALLRILYAANGRFVRAAAAVPGIATPSPRIVAALSLAVSVLLVYGRIWRNSTRNRFDPIR